MTEKVEVKETYGLLSGNSEKSAEVIARGTRGEMEKLLKERLEAFQASRAGVFAKVVKL